jgi:hypothetical protein
MCNLAALHVERHPLHFQLQLPGLGVLQLQPHPLLHLAAGNHHGTVPDERIVVGLEPPADLYVAQQLWITERGSGVDHRLQVDLGLPHEVVLGHHVMIEHLLFALLLCECERKNQIVYLMLHSQIKVHQKPKI